VRLTPAPSPAAPLPAWGLSGLVSRLRLGTVEGQKTADRYAYLGPEGTFTEAALAAFDPAALAGALPCATIQATLDAVRGGEVGRAIVPIENSVEGAVNATLDELATGPDIVICAELLLPVTFALLARPGTSTGDVKTVGGHPQAQAQCRRWLAENLPDAEWMPASSNAEAARQAAEGLIDAALAGAFAADRYGLAVLASEVSDVADAVTRFVVVGRPGPVPAATGADRTSLGRLRPTSRSCAPSGAVWSTATTALSCSGSPWWCGCSCSTRSSRVCATVQDPSTTCEACRGWIRSSPAPRLA